MKRYLNLPVLLLAFVVLITSVSASAFTISPNARFTILTCTPGPDLYSLFGHTAIRLQDASSEGSIDWVYNYGTFQFDDDFYVKFARGKLDYILSKEDFPYFQQEYILTGRGIYEQELLLDSLEKMRLFRLLEENHKAENRTYRYDFFYDNCSTRVRDIIERATSGLEDDGLGFRSPDPEKISLQNRINFSYVYPGKITFRQAIQRYLDYQPWSDFGIDLALGIPCDREIGKNQFMFLPDSLMQDFNYAIYQDRVLVSPSEEILPVEYELSADSLLTPMFVMTLVLVLHLLTGMLLARIKSFRFALNDRILLVATGLLGLLVVFLWFFTDHTATRWNLNILWANPVNLLIACLPVSKMGRWVNTYFTIYGLLLMFLLVCWFILPQTFNLAVIPLVIALLFTSLRFTRPAIFLGSKAIRV